MPPAPLFKPFRALGYITDDVPFVVQRRGKETSVTVSVGRAWQVSQGHVQHPMDMFSSPPPLPPPPSSSSSPMAPMAPVLQIYNCAKLSLLMVGPQVRWG